MRDALSKCQQKKIKKTKGLRDSLKRRVKKMNKTNFIEYCESINLIASEDEYSDYPYGPTEQEQRDRRELFLNVVDYTEINTVSDAVGVLCLFVNPFDCATDLTAFLRSVTSDLKHIDMKGACNYENI